MKARVKATGEIIEVERYPIYNMKTDEPAYRTVDGKRFIKAVCLDFKTLTTEAKIKGWLARDKDKALALHCEEPYRINNGCIGDMSENIWESEAASFLPLDTKLFPELTWDDEPREVEITIKIKE